MAYNRFDHRTAFGPPLPLMDGLLHGGIGSFPNEVEYRLFHDLLQP